MTDIHKRVTGLKRVDVSSDNSMLVAPGRDGDGDTFGLRLSVLAHLGQRKRKLNSVRVAAYSPPRSYSTSHS